MAARVTGKRILISLVLIGVTLFISAGVLLYLLTRPIEIEFAQDPNPLEAHEANRKIKLLDEARDSNRLGFVRLSEVEINSFLEEKFNDPKKNPRTNATVQLVKTAVLLHTTNLTFVNWMEVPLLGIDLPFVWQRTVEPRRERDHWTFDVTTMQLGKLQIPEQIWPQINSLLGPVDGIFKERKSWLQSVPKIAFMKNELSRAPEVRLYSYKPEEKGL